MKSPDESYWLGCCAPPSVRKRRIHTGKTFVGFKASVGFVGALDRAVTLTDSDRSKFIRTALREKLERVS